MTYVENVSYVKLFSKISKYQSVLLFYPYYM